MDTSKTVSTIITAMYSNDLLFISNCVGTHVVTYYALVKVMPHLPPTGDNWGLDLKLLPYLGELDRSPDACIGSKVN